MSRDQRSPVRPVYARLHANDVCNELVARLLGGPRTCTHDDSTA